MTPRVELRRYNAGNQEMVSLEVVDAAGDPYFLPGAERPLFGIKTEVLEDPVSHQEVWRVTNTEATDGYGPLAYDLAMELASLEGRAGLLTGRGSTPDAENVWMYYLENRGDVERTEFPADHPWRQEGKVDPRFPFLWKKERVEFPLF